MSRRAWSSRGRRAASLGMLAMCHALGLPTAAAAQQDPAYTRHKARELSQARLDSLLVVYRVAGDRSNAVIGAREKAEAARAVIGTDTIQVGPTRVVVASGGAARARKYFGRAWAYYGPMLGYNIPPMLESRLFAFQSDFRGRQLDVSGRVNLVDVRPWTSPSRVEAAVRATLSTALLETMPSQQRAWFNGMLISTTPQLATVRRELVVGLSATLGLCRTGHLDACWSAMGVTGSSDPVLNIRIWYTEEQRRALAETMEQEGYSRGTCVAWDMPTCDAYLTGLRRSFVPLSSNSRASLVSVALDLGGEGALRRFAQPLAEGESVRDAIARSAGVEADQVMGEWLKRVLAAQADASASEKEARFGTVLWILLFVALSSRSTRWRLN